MSDATASSEAPRRMRRTPFAALVVLTLAAGLLAQLLLNTTLSQGAFELHDLQQQTGSLTDERQALEQELARLQSPQNLEQRARQLGLIPSDNPAFLDLDDGSVRGTAVPAGTEPDAAGAFAVPGAAAWPATTRGSTA